MRIQVAPLVLLFASVALAAPIPNDSEASLERRAFAGEEEALELFQRDLQRPRARLSKAFAEHGLARGRSPTRGNSKLFRNPFGSPSPERSASRSLSRASSLASSRRGSRSRSSSPAFGLKSARSRSNSLSGMFSKREKYDRSYSGPGPNGNRAGPPHTRSKTRAEAAAPVETNSGGHRTTGQLRPSGTRLAKRSGQKDKNYRGKKPTETSRPQNPARGCNPNRGVGTKWCDRDDPPPPGRDAHGHAVTGNLRPARNPNTHNVKRALGQPGAPAPGGGAHAPGGNGPPAPPFQPAHPQGPRTGQTTMGTHRRVHQKRGNGNSRHAHPAHPAPAPAPPAHFVPAHVPHGNPNNHVVMGGHRP